MTVMEITARLLSAFLFGGIVGLERQIHGRPAGLRTHILVCMGASVAVTAGIMAQDVFPRLSIDTGRIMAGIITGIGFLGAGTIVHYREGVGGLTTAACIWFVAMIGVLCGFGFYLFAGMASLASLLVLLVLDHLEDKLPAASYWKLAVKSECSSLEEFEKQCRDILIARGISVKSTTFRVSGSSVELSLVLRTKVRKTDHGAVEMISRLEGVTSVQWTHRTEEW